MATQEGDNPMYYYEGRDYTEEAKKADADVLESLLKRREPAAGPEDMPMTPRRRVCTNISTLLLIVHAV